MVDLPILDAAMPTAPERRYAEFARETLIPDAEVERQIDMLGLSPRAHHSTKMAPSPTSSRSLPPLGLSPQGTSAAAQSTPQSELHARKPRTPAWDATDSPRQRHDTGKDANTTLAIYKTIDMARQAASSSTNTAVADASDGGPSQLWRRSRLAVSKVSTSSLRPKLSKQIPLHHPLKTRAVVACDHFDHLYYQRAARAERMTFDNQRSPRVHPHGTDIFHDALFAVRVTRYNGPLRPPRAPKIVETGALDFDEVEEEKQAEFDVYKSIWKPRCNWSDAKDLFDTPEVELQRFNSEWSRLLAMGIAKVILKHDDDGEEDDDGDGIPDEVVEVSEVLYRNHMMICLLFAYYASLGGSGVVDSMSYNEWQVFVKEQRLVSKKSKFTDQQGEIDLIFVEVDARAAKLKEAEEKLAEESKLKRGGPKMGNLGGSYVAEDYAKMLNRVEFAFALVIYAVKRYVLSKQILDVSEAVSQFLEVDVLSRAMGDVLLEPNQFRRQHCYSAETTRMLETHEGSLRALFDALTGAKDGASPKRKGGGRGGPLIGMALWVAFLRALRFIDLAVSELEVCLCFVWSRMVVAEPYTSSGHAKECGLPFEGFLEGLVRLSVLKALPSDDQIAAAGCADAAAFIRQLEATSGVSYAAFCKTHNDMQHWGSDPHMQPLHRMVHHLIVVICHTIDFDLIRTPDGKLQPREAHQWCKKRGLVRC